MKSINQTCLLVSSCHVTSRFVQRTNTGSRTNNYDRSFALRSTWDEVNFFLVGDLALSNSQTWLAIENSIILSSTLPYRKVRIRQKRNRTLRLVTEEKAFLQRLHSTTSSSCSQRTWKATHTTSKKSRTARVGGGWTAENRVTFRFSYLRLGSSYFFQFLLQRLRQ